MQFQNHLAGIKVKLFVVTKMIHDEDNDVEHVRTPAMPIILPHHHLLVLFSSRKEGNSLAEAEAALSAQVVLHLGALKTALTVRIYIQAPQALKNK